MKNRRFRPLKIAAVALVTVWGVTWAVFYFADKTKMTAEKAEQFAASVDLTQLSTSDREKAIAHFADMVNALTYEERLKWRRDDGWKKWFAAMTEAERLKFIEATLPTGFAQTLDAFSQLPAEKRKQAVDDSINRLKQRGQAALNNPTGDYGKNGEPLLDPELEKKAREMGLKQLYTDSSAETKADLAPLLEEIQRQIQEGQTR